MPFVGFNQTILSGLFSDLEPLQEHYNYYKFEEDGTFEYHNGASLGDNFYAFGTYSLKNDSLVLNFNETIPLKIGFHSFEIWKNSTKNIEINFNVFSLNKTPASNVNIIYKDSSTKSGYNGIIADKLGRANLKLKKENKNLEISISNIGFKEYKLKIDKNYNYNIDVFLLEQGLGIPIKNQIICYKIVEMRNDYFIVLDENNKKIKWKKR